MEYLGHIPGKISYIQEPINPFGWNTFNIDDSQDGEKTFRLLVGISDDDVSI